MTRTRLLAITAVLAVVSTGVDFAIDADAPGYGVVIGLGACIGIIIISKWFGKLFLQRPDPALTHETEQRGD